MLEKFRKYKKQESGQSMVMVAIFLVVLLGFGALAVDVGAMAFEKSKLQNTADAAALAGAQDLPIAGTAKITATHYATLNGVLGSNTTVTTPYLDPSTNKYDPNKIQVVCTRMVPSIFGKVLGSSGKNVSARAVAQGRNKWVGDALPFINMDPYGPINKTLNAWDKVNPGDKERIDNGDLIIPADNTRIKVDISDELIASKKGKVLSDIMEPLKNILKDGNYVYMFAIRNDLVGISPYDKLQPGYQIPIEDVVLLKCEVIGNWTKNNDLITLKLLKIYNYDLATNGFPQDDQTPIRLDE